MTKQWSSDFHHGRKGQSVTHEVSRYCVECKKPSEPRWLYCSDECALKSLQRVWKGDHPKEPLPPRLVDLEAYREDRAMTPLAERFG